MIIDKIREILKESITEPELIDALSEHDSLENIEINSIASIKIIVALEDCFGIEFDNDMLNIEMFRSIASIAEYVERKINEKQ